MLLVMSNPALFVTVRLEATISEATISEATISEATISEAMVSEVAVSEAAASKAVESAVRSVQNTETFTARLWVSENALTYSAVCSSESHFTFSCEFR